MCIICMADEYRCVLIGLGDFRLALSRVAVAVGNLAQWLGPVAWFSHLYNERQGPPGLPAHAAASGFASIAYTKPIYRF